jgi:hypothetical protein
MKKISGEKYKDKLVYCCALIFRATFSGASGLRKSKEFCRLFQKIPERPLEGIIKRTPYSLFCADFKKRDRETFINWFRA